MSLRSRVLAATGSMIDAIDDRTGACALAHRLLDRPVAGGPSRRHALGAALAAMILLQVVTGLAMTFYYAPSTTTAWESVVHLEEQVLLGRVLRGLHAFGASMVVVLVASHLISAGLARAYRFPREAAWLSGLVLVPVVLGFALTGYLLPWDQKGYWATQVAIGITRATPFVGQAAGQVLQGGPDLGTLTLTRFYALHTMVLPLTLGLLTLAHLSLVRRAAVHAGSSADGATPWWPGQAWRDGLAVAAVAGLVLALAVLGGPELDAPADPTSNYPPRPEWYFAPLRQLLKTVPEPWGSLVLPGGALLLLCALPWLDRADRPRPRLARLVLLGPPCVALALGAQAMLADGRDEDYQQARVVAEHDAALARSLMRGGVPPGGAADLLWLHPPRRGLRLFQTHCQSCHLVEGKGGEEGPDLTGYLSSSWLEGVIRSPRDPRFFGHTKLGKPDQGMEPLPPEEWPKLRGLAAFLQAQDPALAPALAPALVKAGEDAYYELECHGCHSMERDEVGSAPNLAGYGTPAWLDAFLRDPGHALFYGEDNDMPAYADELEPDELAALVVFLRGLDPARRPTDQ